MSRRTMTRDQVLAWNSKWSYTDREAIAYHLDRLGARTFYMPPSGGYIGCMDEDGTRVLFIGAGWLSFRRGQAPESLPEGWDHSMPLSTFQGHASPRSEWELDETFCERCHMSLPATGKCDQCDD